MKIDIDDELINQFAPKVVEGVKKLKSWSDNLKNLELFYKTKLN